MAIATANVAVHGIAATFSMKPPGAEASQPADIQPTTGLVGLGTRNANRSRPAGLLRQNVRGAIHCRSPMCAAITVSTGDSMTVHAAAATVAGRSSPWNAAG